MALRCCGSWGRYSRRDTGSAAPAGIRGAVRAACARMANLAESVVWGGVAGAPSGGAIRRFWRASCVNANVRPVVNPARAGGEILANVVPRKRRQERPVRNGLRVTRQTRAAWRRKAVLRMPEAGIADPCRGGRNQSLSARSFARCDPARRTPPSAPRRPVRPQKAPASRGDRGLPYQVRIQAG